ncbi:MAG: MAPEG family protein, partial [Rhizobiales bacterium]|nr:MAPEG family protein [Hyphomicrobiales bacterium]
MNFPLITITAAIALTILFIVLTARVSIKRQSENIPLGNGDTKPVLMKAIRAQGNLAESMPLFIVLLYLVETNGASTSYVWALAGFYCFVRLSHAIGISQQKDFSLLRAIGGGGTLLSLVALCVFLALQI